MSSQDSSLFRQSIIRFDLESVSLSGSLNNFKEPQLVLKAQNASTPRVPFTGSRARRPVRRHLLMIHVKDKASELEMLDLAAFVAPAGLPDPMALHVVEVLPNERSLVFQYPKPVTQARYTLRAKFRTAADLSTVVSELRALGIQIEVIRTGQQLGFSIEEALHRIQTAPTPAHTTGLIGNPRELYTSNSPLSKFPDAEERQTSCLTSPAYRLIPQRRSSQPQNQRSGIPFIVPVKSPVNPPPRPATTIGIPGILGEGVYRISRVGSAPGTRAGVRRVSRLSEPQGSRFYTVSKHFDKTLVRDDIIRLTSDRFPGYSGKLQSSHHDEELNRVARKTAPSDDYGPTDTGNGPPPGRLRPTSLTGEGPAATEGFLRSPGRLPLSQGTSVLQPISEHAAKFASQHTSISQPHEGTHTNIFTAGDLLHWPLSGLSSQLEPPSTTVDRGGGTPSTQRSADASPSHDGNVTANDILLETVFLTHGGLREATRIWDDLIDKGRNEAELAGTLEEAEKIWSKYGEEWAGQLDKVAASVANKMADVGNCKILI